MKKKIMGITMAFCLGIIIITAGLYLWMVKSEEGSTAGKQLVTLNEVRQLALDNEELQPALDELEISIKQSDFLANQSFIIRLSISIVVIGLLYTVALFVYIYREIIRPFQKLEKYADEIAAGNMDVRLEYERTNYFGAFTWAFDHMRKEILFARKREAEAIESNKTIVASLSHDIKTPIASIRAYSEALEANLGADFEKRQQYAGTIMRKCDEVTALVNDLVLHSLSELEKLEIKNEEVQIAQVIRTTVKDLGFDCLTLREPVPEAVVMGDEKRIAQILENLLNNSRKYATGAAVEIYVENQPERYVVHVRDYGPGIPPEDMPFIKDKFYRGNNVEDMPGSGLGLYIVNYIVEEMKGSLQINNCQDGLDVSFELLKTS